MGGRGGLLREYDWNGKVLWEHRHVGQHHDFRRLPNGNTIFLGWEVVPPEIEKRIPGGIAGTCHPDGCMYGDTIHEITPDGKTVWEWHACRDMEVENYPLFRNQLRDEFAHANAISPLPNGDIYISFRRLNMIGLIDKQTAQDEMAASRRQLRHAARLRAAAERQHHAVRQRHQHHRPIRFRA